MSSTKVVPAAASGPRASTPPAGPQVIKKVETKVKTSFEDVEGLLNNLLMLTTFTLGFSISFIAAFEYGALAEIDVRYYNLHKAYPGEVEKAFPSSPKGVHNIFSPSGTMLERGMWSTTIMSISLTIALGSYVSMCASDAREDEKFFKKWYATFKWIIIFGYFLYFVAYILFYLMLSTAAIGLFPRYCDTKKGGSGSVWLTEKSFQSDGKGDYEIVEGCLREGIRYPVDAMTLLLNIAMPVIFIAIFLISLWMHRKEKIIRLRGAIAAPLHGRWK